MTLRSAAGVLMAALLASPATAQVLDKVPDKSTRVASVVAKNAVIGFCPQMVLNGRAVGAAYNHGLEPVDTSGPVKTYAKDFIASNITVVFDSAENTCTATETKSLIPFDPVKTRRLYEARLRVEGFVLDPRSEDERVFIKTDGVYGRVLTHRLTTDDTSVSALFSVAS